MNWFQGSIGEAIVASKAKPALFVVFIAGDDDASKSTTSAIESHEVSSKLGSDDFVAIRLESGSEPYRQFVQIYQLVPIPSLFFIGKNGEPVEILAGERTATQLCGHIDQVLEKCGKRAPAQDSAASSSKDVASKAEATTKEAVPQNVPVLSAPVTSEKAPESEKSPAVVIPQASGQSSGSTASAIVNVKAETSSEVEMQDDKVPEKETDMKKDSDEAGVGKVDHAKELIAQRRQEREMEEQAKDLEREEMRRRSGKETARFRREQDERNVKAAQKEREREKAEEKAARERILKQIAMDRAEHSARYEAEKNAAKKRKLEEDQRKASEEQERASQLAAARREPLRKRTQKMNRGQTAVLVNYMYAHKNFALGKFQGPTGKLAFDKQWKALKDLLNEHGPRKTVMQWRKAWKDLKSKVRGKIAHLHRERTNPGLVAGVTPPLSAIEEKVKSIVGSKMFLPQMKSEKSDIEEKVKSVVGSKISLPQTTPDKEVVVVSQGSSSECEPTDGVILDTFEVFIESCEATNGVENNPTSSPIQVATQDEDEVPNTRLMTTQDEDEVPNTCLLTTQDEDEVPNTSSVSSKKGLIKDLNDLKRKMDVVDERTTTALESIASSLKSMAESQLEIVALLKAAVAKRA